MAAICTARSVRLMMRGQAPVVLTRIARSLTCSSALQRERLTKSYVHQSSMMEFSGRTIGQVLEDITAKYPNKEAFVFCSEGIRKTYREVLDDVRHAAAGFIALGVKRGDRLGLWGPNTYDWVVTELGASMMGAILVSINPGYRTEELKYCLNKVEVKTLVSAPNFRTSDYYGMLEESCPELATCQPGQLKSKNVPSLENVVMMGDKDFKGTFKLSEVLSIGKDEHFQELKKVSSALDADNPINIQFTSGTTGFPKGCTLSHHTLLNNALSIGRSLHYHGEDTRICLPIPLYHAFACTGGPLTTITIPAVSVFPSEGFEPEATLKAISDEKVSTLYATPTIFTHLLHHPNFHKYNYASLESALMGGAPCPPALLQEVMDKMNLGDIAHFGGEFPLSPHVFCPPARLLEVADEVGISNKSIGYGLTETGPAMTISPRELPPFERIKYVGATIDHQELKIVDPETKHTLPINTQGEVCCRGYNVMLGYWEEEERTNEVIDHAGWFYTGDLGVMSEEGHLKITGRIKDMIIRGGENIFPTEVENFLLQHPKIANVQVVGIPDDVWGEQVCACIVLKEGEAATEEEMIEHCKGKITHFKVPHYILFVEDYPLTVTFKVKKFELRDIATEKLTEEGRLGK